MSVWGIICGGLPLVVVVWHFFLMKFLGDEWTIPNTYNFLAVIPLLFGKDVVKRKRDSSSHLIVVLFVLVGCFIEISSNFPQWMKNPQKIVIGIVAIWLWFLFWLDVLWIFLKFSSMNEKSPKNSNNFEHLHHIYFGWILLKTCLQRSVINWFRLRIFFAQYAEAGKCPQEAHSKTCSWSVRCIDWSKWFVINKFY
jgi:hypothetical protein